MACKNSFVFYLQILFATIWNTALEAKYFCLITFLGHPATQKMLNLQRPNFEVRTKRNDIYMVTSEC